MGKFGRKAARKDGELMMNQIKYRPEVDGLRALSVLLVLFFHLGYQRFAGGYVGVDVFFVISGYLITQVLVDQDGKRRISAAEFYVRRIKRLAPALLVLLAVCFVAGYFVLSPGDYTVTSVSGLNALIGASNIYFLFNSGYFDAITQSMVLLHTWSLGVEEQFYLVWPLLLWTLAKSLRGWRLLGALVLLAGLSFALGVRAASDADKAGFYLAHLRAWELLTGAIISLIPSASREKVPAILQLTLPLVGIAAIIFAATYFDKHTPYPGYQALIPVLGAAAFLFPGSSAGFVFRLFSTRSAVLLGKASYSIYLYHWPLIVFWLHYSSFEPLSDDQRIFLSLLACALGIASWKFVEQPFRRISISAKTVVIRFVAAEIFLGGLFGFTAVHAGVPGRIPESVRSMGSLQQMWQWDTECSPRPHGCEVGTAWNVARTRIAVVGDSHAQHFMPVLAAAAQGKNVSIRLFNTCSPVIDGAKIKAYELNVPRYNLNCVEVREAALKSMRQEPPQIVVAASAWTGIPGYIVPALDSDDARKLAIHRFNIGLANFISEIRQFDVKIVLIADVPRWRNDPVPCYISQQTSLVRKRCAAPRDTLDRSYFDREQAPVLSLLRAFEQKDAVTVLAPSDALCTTTGCKTIVNGEFLYRDSDHIRRNLKRETLSEVAHLLRLDRIMDLHNY
jgi:peptidoglycan/LPS O-acetylase OafA/YrhL